MASTSTFSGHTSPASLTRKNSNFNIRSIFRSSNKSNRRHKSKESIDTVSMKSVKSCFFYNKDFYIKNFYIKVFYGKG